VNTASAPKNPVPDTIAPRIPYSEIFFTESIVLIIPRMVINADITGIRYEYGEWNPFAIVSNDIIAIPSSETSIPKDISTDKKNPVIIE
jgi:hypothetical protein